MNSPINIILSMSPFGFYRLDNEPNHRYISSIWTGGGIYEIHGVTGVRRYIGYNKRDAMRLYNRLARGEA